VIFTLECPTAETPDQEAHPVTAARPQSYLHAPSTGVEDTKAIGFRWISINDLDWRSGPLPNTDGWRAGELDLPAGTFHCDPRPGFGNPLSVHTVRTQHIGEDGDCVVALEGDEGTVTYRDLSADPIPYMNLRTMPSSHPLAIASDMLAEEERSVRREEALDEFLSAEVVVLGITMYNFGIAAQLKSWLDAIVIPGKTFTYTADGPKGLAGAKRVILAITRGGILQCNRSHGKNGTCRITCALRSLSHRNR
jgi:putative NADPH-quinone reductase